MYIPELKYHKPKTIDEAYRLLGTYNNSALLAGGTDLLVEIKQGVRNFDNIISLNDINDLKIIEVKNDSIIIGSCVTHNEIINSDIIKIHLPALTHAVSTIGTHQIRNTASIGGNLCTCASCADSAPIMMIYNAEMEIGSKVGSRTLKLSDFFMGHHVNALKEGELLLRIIVPKPKPNFGAHYEKFGLRESASISVASVAVSVSIEDDIIKEANIVIGACAPTPMQIPTAMKKLVGIDINELKKGSAQLNKVGDSAASEVKPIDDIRGSADYR
ncbi:FAD binding domain-containing protein, partial [Bacteroidota bacterium]